MTFLAVGHNTNEIPLFTVFNMSLYFSTFKCILNSFISVHGHIFDYETLFIVSDSVLNTRKIVIFLKQLHRRIRNAFIF